MDYKIRGKIIGTTGTSDLVVSDGRITAISPADRSRADYGSSASFIIPPLFDMQVNGIAGLDLQIPGLTPDTVGEMTRVLAANGVACWCPTLITGPLPRMTQACRAIERAIDQNSRIARAIPGIHLEGPHISPMDGPRGAHGLQYVRKPDRKLFDSFYDAARGKIAYVTIAPELPGAIDYIRHVTQRGVVAALGHHNASADHIARAVDAGATLSTHLGNGLASMINRHQNPLWPQLVQGRLAASVIPDLEHLPPDVLTTFLHAKGLRNIALVSDCVHIAGLPPGDYDLGGQPVELLPSGRVCLKGTGLLAGSSLMLVQGVVNFAHCTRLSLPDAVACATSVPRRILKAKCRFQPPTVGKKANFIVLDIVKKHTPPRADLRAVFIEGEKQCK